MKKNFYIFPFLVALYPLLTLYSRNPGEILIQETVRPFSVALLFTLLLFGAFYLYFKNCFKAGFIATAVVFYFSSSGHVYRILKSYLFPQSSLQFHFLLLAFEIFLVLLIAHPAAWNRYITPAREYTIAKYMNIVAILIIIYPLAGIVRFAYFTVTDGTKPLLRDNIKNDQLPRSVSLPDIYYIVLDGYGRSDVLDGLYDIDNSAFLGELKERGFYIAAASHSNYLQTPLSFASFLNSAYFEETAMDGNSINRLPLFSLIRESHAIRLLRQSGYEIIATDSGFQFTDIPNADKVYSPFSRSLTTFERFFLSTTAFDALTEIDGPIGEFMRKTVSVPGYNTHRDGVLYALDAITKVIPGDANPKFVLVHIVSPHPPFVLDSMGNPIESSRPYMPGDGEAFGGTPEEYQELYKGQVEYINVRIIEAIDSILANSATPPIIILQGDHGPGSLLRRDSLADTCLWERSSILNAYHFPDGVPDEMYQSITPVNTFRVIFNNYFGTSYPLLPDRIFFSTQAFPYAFTDITYLADTVCAIGP